MTPFTIFTNKMLNDFNFTAQTIIYNDYNSFPFTGWIFNNFHSIKMYISKYIPCAGAAYIPTPTKLEKKKCLVNIKNTDSKCFIYSVISSLYPVVSKHGYTSRNFRYYKHFEKRIITKGKKLLYIA